MKPVGTADKDVLDANKPVQEMVDNPLIDHTSTLNSATAFTSYDMLSRGNLSFGKDPPSHSNTSKKDQSYK